jgi:anti-sigma B factor antagonist
MSSIVDDFAVEFLDDGCDVTIRVVGEVDMATAGLLAAQLERAVEGCVGAVTVNMAGVTFLDSTGLTVLLRARAALIAVDRDLVVTAPSRPTTRIFELTGLHDTFRLASEPG